ncbi:hypothetical protein Glove_67g112 [Diversispora epigaea]|uniref:TLDc domain-containing protein n=1 Tax=Diversispora epigaea TaxID=1348612 RepID=A0A397JH53_9GLOM|nr:hypothetical protein Glove_67g112 [Diversispora epigaea]
MGLLHKHFGITVVVMKVKGTDGIFGGYNPLAWDKTINETWNEWMETKDYFIFSLKKCRVSIIRYAICNVSKYHQNNYGPHFGNSKESNFTSDNNNYY